jgi:hypothetical protein
MFSFNMSKNVNPRRDQCQNTGIEPTALLTRASAIRLFQNLTTVVISTLNPILLLEPSPTSLKKVEVNGVEPMTPCLQSRCSSQLSYTPKLLISSPEQI